MELSDLDNDVLVIVVSQLMPVDIVSLRLVRLVLPDANHNPYALNSVDRGVYIMPL